MSGEEEVNVYYVPTSVMRSDQTIVAWDDVPIEYQRKILNGTMTDEDWDAEWDIVAKFFRQGEREVEDVVSDMLNDVPPVAKHVHVWRKEYDKCMLKGCEVTKHDRYQ